MEEQEFDLIEVDVPIINGGDFGALHAQLADIGRIPLSARPTFWLIVREPGTSGRSAPVFRLDVFVMGMTTAHATGAKWKVNGLIQNKTFQDWAPFAENDGIRFEYDTASHTGTVTHISRLA